MTIAILKETVTCVTASYVMNFYISCKTRNIKVRLHMICFRFTNHTVLKQKRVIRIK